MQDGHFSGAIYDLHPISREEPHNLMGRVYIFGVPHHLFAVRVQDVEGEQKGFHDPYDRLKDAVAGDAGYCYWVEIPGRVGKYVVFIQPHRGG